MSMRAAAILLVAVAAHAGSIRGRLLDPDGKPLTWTAVTAYCVSSEDPLRRSATTDGQGVFVIADLPPGAYVIEQGAPEKAKEGERELERQIRETREIADHVLRASRARVHPHRVEVGDGVVEHDIRQRRSQRVTVVLDRDGRALPGAAVGLVELDAQGAPLPRFVPSEKPRTDARGEIAFPAVPEASYGVTCSVGDWSVRCGRFEVLGGPARVPASIGSLEVRLRVLDARDQPVTSAWPRLEAEGWRGVWVEPQGVGDRAGLYVVPGLREGEYVPRVTVGGATAEAGPIAVGRELPRPEVTLRLPETGSMTVRVLDAAGKPVPDDIVTIRAGAGEPLTARTDGNGTARFGYLPTGVWQVWHLGWEATPEDVVIRAFTQSSATLRPVMVGSLVVLVLGRDGTGAKNVYVRIRHSSGAPTYDCKTDGNGRIRFREIAAGEWSIRVDREKQAVRVLAGQPAVATLLLR